MWNKPAESESGLHTMQPLRTRIEGTVVGDGNLPSRLTRPSVYPICCEDEHGKLKNRGQPVEGDTFRYVADRSFYREPFTFTAVG